MPLTNEQQAHLQAGWQNIQLRANETAANKQRELLGIARAKNNAAALPIAYSEAALYRLELTVRDQLAWTTAELENMGITLDSEAEKVIQKHFNIMTSMQIPLHFPPGMTAMHNLSANHSAHARARQRLNNQLQREATTAIKSLKLKAAPHPPMYAVNVQNTNSPGARTYLHSVDDSVNNAVPEDIALLLTNLSANHSELTDLAGQIFQTPSKASRAEKAVRWLSVASNVEGLAEKVHAATPAITSWVHHLLAAI